MMGISLDSRFVPPGTFAMGSERFYPEEAPEREIEVGAFRIDRTPVTNARFARFVVEAGHETCAERAGGGLVFRGGARGDDNWAFVAGASWRHPYGPESSIADMSDHPVVLVSPADALAFAEWSGGRLPTEAEWEWAARGGIAGLDYAWGDDLHIDGDIPANVWKGIFPVSRKDGLEAPFTTPVGRYAENGFGLHDMIGNVWELTADRVTHVSGGCCSARDGSPRLAAGHVIKGGSHLCAENHCRRYRPAARQTMSEPTSHIGFRCVT